MRAGAFVADRGLTTGAREIGFAPVSPAHGVIHRPRRVKAQLTWEKRVAAQGEGKSSATDHHYTRPDPSSIWASPETSAADVLEFVDGSPPSRLALFGGYRAGYVNCGPPVLEDRISQPGLRDDRKPILIFYLLAPDA
jgi:hypothetical protein